VQNWNVKNKNAANEKKKSGNAVKLKNEIVREERKKQEQRQCGNWKK
jgi:hypothetical protein